MNKKVEVNTNSGTYTGNVKMTLKKGDKPYKVVKQHNKGTVEFFKYILNVVRGEVLPKDRPGKVKLIYDEGEEGRISKYGVMYENVTSATGIIDSGAPKATITYSFIIPETVVEVNKLRGLQLESVSGVVYAKVDFTEYIEIKKNTNIELDWDLNISNN